jgi:hypothetical protein
MELRLEKFEPETQREERCGLPRQFPAFVFCEERRDLSPLIGNQSVSFEINKLRRNHFSGLRVILPKPKSCSG